MTATDTCPWCGESIDATDTTAAVRVAHGTLSGMQRQFWHVECWQRQAVGSVGHQIGKCSCYGGDLDDPPEMTRRDAARMAVWLATVLRENKTRSN